MENGGRVMNQSNQEEEGIVSTISKANSGLPQSHAYENCNQCPTSSSKGDVKKTLPPLPPRNPINSIEKPAHGHSTPPTPENYEVPAIAPLSLVAFVEKYSDSLPVSVQVEKGHYGSSNPETVSISEKFIVALIKSRKVLSIQTYTNTEYSLPFGSAVQLSLLYNPEGNAEKAQNDGYTFESVHDLVSNVHCPCPQVVCATKTAKGDTFKSGVYENEILLVEKYDNHTKKLQVISLGPTPVKKSLPLECGGCFTTKPSAVPMYVSDVYNYVNGDASKVYDAILHFDQHANLSTNIQRADESLRGVVRLKGFVMERSLVCFSVPDSAHEEQAFEIPVNSTLDQVEITVQQPRINLEKFSPDDYFDLPYFQQEELTSGSVQTFFYEHLRLGHEREGVMLCNNVYDEVLDPKVQPVSTPGASTAATNTPDGLSHFDLEYRHLHSRSLDQGGVLQKSKIFSPSATAQASSHITKAEIETTMRSVLFEVLPEVSSQRIAPASYTSVDPSEAVKLNAAIIELSEIENLWYFFGIHLGIHKFKLDQIHANHGIGPNPSGRCLIEVICQWHENAENPTWETIAKALYSIGKKQLAKEISSKHGVAFEDVKQKFMTSVKQYIPGDKLSEVDYLQQEVQAKDQQLREVTETLVAYEQKMEKQRKELKDIKCHLQFNERFTRMYTLEKEILQKKHEKRVRSPDHEKESEKRISSKRQLRDSHSNEQKTYRTRLNTARQEATELKHQLFLIKNQTDEIKEQLYQLLDQKHELKRELDEQESQLNQIVTRIMEEDSTEKAELPEYYNIIRCDGRVEVKLHEEELSMLQQNLEKKTEEVQGLKNELGQRYDQVAQLQALLAKQALDDEVACSEATEHDILERHRNDHLKTRLEMEVIECQVQLTNACLQKKEVESKLERVEHRLQRSKKIYQRAQELYLSTLASQKAKLPSISSHESSHLKKSLPDPELSLVRTVSDLDTNTENVPQKDSSNKTEDDLQQEIEPVSTLRQTAVSSVDDSASLTLESQSQ